MTRANAALSRLADGRTPILPPEVEASAGDGAAAEQPTFAVPWKLDPEAPPAPADRSARAGAPLGIAPTPAGRRGFAYLPPARRNMDRAEASEKLVGMTASGDRVSLLEATEQYRKLVATLDHPQADRSRKVIVVTSASQGEGKSLTASNLALTLAESYQRRVLLIDGDLRRPSLHETFEVTNKSGLSDGLAGSSNDQITVRGVSERLSILPSGPSIDDPTGAITSDRMARVLEEARERFDWVIIDTPPIGMVSDGKLLAGMADGVVLVVEAGKSAYPDVIRAVETLGRDRVIGVVLNRIKRVPWGSRYYSDYYRRTKAPQD